MSTTNRITALSLAAAFACGLTASANAQLITHKDLSTEIALTLRRIRQGAMCSAAAARFWSRCGATIPARTRSRTRFGVSGAPGGDKDEACAKAGIDKVSAELK
jgi:uncharacterized protein GlcG (DUF336 family)